MSLTSGVAFNVLTRWGAITTRAAIGIVLVPFLLGLLGKETYGLVGLVGSIVTLAMLADLGLSSALSRHLAVEVASENNDVFNRLVSTAIVFYVIVGALLAVGIAFLAPYLVRLFTIPEGQYNSAVMLVRWFGALTFFMTFLRAIVIGILTSHSRFDLINGMETLAGILRGAALFAVLPAIGPKLVGYSVVCLGAQAVELVLLWIMAGRVCTGLVIRPGSFDWQQMRRLLSLGGYMLAFQITGLISVHSDPLVIGYFLGTAAVAIYTPATVVSQSFRPLVNSLVSQLHPLATGLHVKGDEQQLQKMLVRGTKYTLLLGIPVCVIFSVFALPVCNIWLSKGLGSDYTMVAWVLIGWMVVDLFNYASGAQGPVLIGMNRLGFMVWTQLPLSIVNIAASIYLVGWTSLGVVGVVVPTAAIAILRRPMLIWYTAKACNMKPMTYFVRGYLRAMVVLGGLLALALWLSWTFEPHSLFHLALCVTAVGMAWLSLVVMVGLNTEDRRSIAVALRGIAHRLVGARAPGSTPKNVSSMNTEQVAGDRR